MKKKLFIFLVLLLSFTLNSLEVKILWWNVKNFFDTVDDPLTDDTVLSKKEYYDKLQIISDVIKKINPDIAGLAEVENLSVLKDISKTTGLQNYNLIDGNDPRGIDVCLLSKFPVEYITHKNTPTPYKGNNKYKFSRDCPEAVMKINNKKIYILLNHLKAESYDEKNNELKRSAQSKGILDIILSIYKKNKDEPNIIILGDFNSSRHTEPMSILEKSGLQIINYLYKEKPTYISSKIQKEIDYIIFNKKLFREVKIKKFLILSDKDIKKASDHLPIYLEIEI